ALREKKTVGPGTLVWVSTLACNLNCKHCYVSAGNVDTSNELSTDEIMRVITEVRNLETRFLLVSGGEPLMRHDLSDVVRFAKKSGMDVIMSTNGTLITKEKAIELKEIGVGVVGISIDGFQTHDEFRGLNGALKASIEGLKNCIEVGLATAVRTVVTQHNLNEIMEIVEKSIAMDVDEFTLMGAFPEGRAKLAHMDEAENRANMKKIAAKILENKAIQPLRVNNRHCVFALPHSLQRKDDLFSPWAAQIKEIGSGCTTPYGYCFLHPDGNYYSCPVLRVPFGNIRTAPLDETYRTSEYIHKFTDRSNLKGKCNTCYIRDICGGCRARAYLYTNDPFESDPGGPLLFMGCDAEEILKG
ncbi:MAG: radical SAM protein, partial [Desulfobacteraceae bacterium]